MKQTFYQRPLQPWTGGDSQSILVLRAEPEELTSRLGIQFTEYHDNLDRLLEAVIELNSGRQVLFARYQHNPSPGTEIHVDARDSAPEAREDVFAALSMNAADCSWIAGVQDQVGQ